MTAKLPRTSFRPIRTKIVGVTHQNYDGSSRQKLLGKCQVGEILVLVRDHDNPHDRNAVAPFRQEGGQLGYLSKEVARDVAKLLDADRPILAEILSLTGGGFMSGKSRGCNIEIFELDEKKWKAENERS